MSACTDDKAPSAVLQHRWMLLFASHTSSKDSNSNILPYSTFVQILSEQLEFLTAGYHSAIAGKCWVWWRYFRIALKSYKEVFWKRQRTGACQTELYGWYQHRVKKCHANYWKRELKAKWEWRGGRVRRSNSNPSSPVYHSNSLVDYSALWTADLRAMESFPDLAHNSSGNHPDF